jgi:predicted membrane channel-forming protein YqfA (hemolysin III family)
MKPLVTYLFVVWLIIIVGLRLWLGSYPACEFWLASAIVVSIFGTAFYRTAFPVDED